MNNSLINFLVVEMHYFQYLVVQGYGVNCQLKNLFVNDGLWREEYGVLT